jgi:hypothetical protein
MSPRNGKIERKLTASVAACHDGGEINRLTDPYTSDRIDKSRLEED